MNATTFLKPLNLALLVVLIVVIMGIGSALGIGFRPGVWYAGLIKPSFNPPNWLFGPVWSTLYVMIAIAGWRTFLRDRSGTAMKFWLGQMLFNWIWTPVMFGAQLIWPAFAVLLLMLASIIGFIAVSRREDPISAWLFVPYLAWVSFAGLLNLSLGILNS